MNHEQRIALAHINNAVKRGDTDGVIIVQDLYSGDIHLTDITIGQDLRQVQNAPDCRKHIATIDLRPGSASIADQIDMLSVWPGNAATTPIRPSL